MNLTLYVLIVFVLILVVVRLRNKAVSFEGILGAFLFAIAVVYVYRILFPSTSLAVKYDDMIERKQGARVDFLRSVGFPV